MLLLINQPEEKTGREGSLTQPDTGKHYNTPLKKELLLPIGVIHLHLMLCFNMSVTGMLINHNRHLLGTFPLLVFPAVCDELGSYLLHIETALMVSCCSLLPRSS